MADVANTGTIHDIGYQRYTGQRLGRGHAVRSLYVYSFRTVFGMGRSAKAKIFPFSVAGILLVIAVVAAAVKAQFKVEIPQLSYVDFPGTLSFLLVLLLAAVAPELASRDLRNKVLPLYFSRPIGRDDYVLAKLAALVTAVSLILAVPLFVMFLGGAFSGSGLSGAWGQFTDFLPGLLNAVIYAIVLSAVALLIASLSSRRTIAAGAVVAVFLVTTPISGVLQVVGTETMRQLASLFSITGILSGLRNWLFGGSAEPAIGSFGPLYAGAAVVLVALCTALLVYRYRKVAS
ncbi:ABC transporter permease [Actinocatenispora rupis]|uniref:Membrane protein n=1 Tax=Actinocatenispora rupis TaxID=519421 RepID=A0A8J3J6L1_9ACTN|nr:ABC transporter permease [Actinocatenispora rupis]GID10348.1 membrane protein [Actinocatenispora rupis]